MEMSSGKVLYPMTLESFALFCQKNPEVQQVIPSELKALSKMQYDEIYPSMKETKRHSPEYRSLFPEE